MGPPLLLVRACLYGGELPGKASYSPRRDKQGLCLYETEILGICRMIAAWRRNGARTQKGFKSFETLKNITKCRQNTRISAEQFTKTYLSIRMYFWAIIFQMQSKYILSWAAELPRQSVYMENIHPAKASYSAASCKHAVTRDYY